MKDIRFHIVMAIFVATFGLPCSSRSGRDKARGHFALYGVLGLLWVSCFLLIPSETAVARAQGPPREQATVQLGWFRQYQFAGDYAAVEKGFYIEAQPAGLADHRQSFGIRQDLPELRSIIATGLASISDAELAASNSKYTHVRYDRGSRKNDHTTGLAIIGAAFGLVICTSILWNARQRRKEAGRIIDLDRTDRRPAAENDQRLNPEKAFRASRKYLYNLTNSIADAVVSVRIPGRTIEWANDAIKTLGYKHDEIIGRTTEFIYARYDDFIAIGRKIEASIEAGKGDIVTEMMLKKKNGDIFPAEITISFFEENGEIVSATAIIRDTSERRERERQIEAYQQRLKSLAAKLTLSEENERRRMAISLHDHVGQSLTIARLQLAAAQQAIGDDALKTRLEETSRTLLEAVQETRHLIFDLSISAIRELGLQAAIKDWIDEKMPQHGIEAELIDNTTDPNAVALKDNAAALLFRHTKELLTNVIKHARADTVTVKVTHAPDEIFIVVHDNGIGFDARGFCESMSLADNFGLFSIHEGMLEMGGALQIESEPGKGCRAMLRLPMKESARSNAQPFIPRIADSKFPFEVGQ